MVQGQEYTSSQKMEDIRGLENDYRAMDDLVNEERALPGHGMDTARKDTLYERQIAVSTDFMECIARMAEQKTVQSLCRDEHDPLSQDLMKTDIYYESPDMKVKLPEMDGMERGIFTIPLDDIEDKGLIFRFETALTKIDRAAQEKGPDFIRDRGPSASEIYSEEIMGYYINPVASFIEDLVWNEDKNLENMGTSIEEMIDGGMSYESTRQAICSALDSMDLSHGEYPDLAEMVMAPEDEEKDERQAWAERIHDDPSAIKDIPVRYVTKDIIMDAIRQDPDIRPAAEARVQECLAALKQYRERQNEKETPEGRDPVGFEDFNRDMAARDRHAKDRPQGRERNERDARGGK